jgi:predicted O-linked N-acetylglucosamine transferase (SPINDLY family)
MGEASLEQLLNDGLARHRAGRHQEAVAISRRVLGMQPNHPGALHLIGQIEAESGRLDAAADLFRRAVAAAPNNPDFHFDLGNLLRHLGKSDEAAACYQSAIKLRPGFSGAHSDLGALLKSKGQLDQAIECYQRALLLNPDDIPALINFGNALLDKGKPDLALARYERAIEIKPDIAEAHAGLANALKDLGQLDRAIAIYEHALRLNPMHVPSHFNLGEARTAKGELAAAAESYRQTIALRPGFAEAYMGLANALLIQGQPDEAIENYRLALARRPEFPEANNNLAKALVDNGEVDEAIGLYHRALAQKPDFAEALYNLGNAWKRKGRLDKSIECLRRAIAIKPSFAEAHNNLGISLFVAGQLGPAIESFQKTLALKTHSAVTQYNLANALRDSARFDDAIASYQRAIVLDPKLIEAHNNLGSVLRDSGELDLAIASYRRALALDPAYISARDNLLFALPFHPDSTAQSLLHESRLWSRQHAEPLKKFLLPHGNDRKPDRRLRIGLISPDFRNHPIGRFILPLVVGHNRQALEIFCYADNLAGDDITATLKSHCGMWRNISGLSNEKVAELIRQDGVDILVDLTMHMADNRLLVFARKPAPVQVTYLAFLCGTGLDTIDYRFTDRFIDPDEADDKFYTEKSVRLTASYWCYQPSLTTGPVNELPALSKGAVTFGCLNNFAKVSAAAIETWARLLNQISVARLLLHSQPGSHCQRTLEFLSTHGVSSDRIEIVGRVSTPQYFETYRRIDIALDPFPYPGGTTTCDALWMGVPVVTLAGANAVARAGVSILSNAGLPELIATSLSDYVRIAADLAGDLTRLAGMRSTLRDRLKHSALMDAERYCRSVEAAFRHMWQALCAS